MRPAVPFNLVRLIFILVVKKKITVVDVRNVLHITLANTEGAISLLPQFQPNTLIQIKLCLRFIV